MMTAEKNIINELPKEWKLTPMKDVAEINPKLPNKDKLSNMLEVQFLPMKLVEEVNNKIHLIETRKLEEVLKGSYTPFINGDVIFAKVTPCMENGKIALVENLMNGIGFGSSEFHVIRVGNQIIGKYIFNFLVQDRFRNEAANEMTGAVGLRRVPKQFLENYLIPFPSLQTQQAIVSKIEELFSELDKGIENLRTAQQQLKTYRQAVLKWAFEGKLTNENVKEDELPKGWKTVSITQLAEKSKHAIKAGPFGSSLKKEFYVEKGYKIYGQEQVISGDPFYGNYYINEEKYQELISCKIKPFDILISLVGTVGKVLLLPENCEEGIINPRLIKISLDINIYLPKFFKYYFESSAVKSFYSAETRGTTMDVLNLGIIKTIAFPICPINEQHNIIQAIESRLSVADKIEESIIQSLQQAEGLRQSILKKAFEGSLV